MNFLGKLLGIAIFYCLKWLAEIAITWKKDEDIKAEAKKQIQEALLMKDKKEAAKKLNGIFKL